jgi:hypothetical protein
MRRKKSAPLKAQNIDFSGGAGNPSTLGYAVGYIGAPRSSAISALFARCLLAAANPYPRVEGLVYDDDEDEFGLPSLASMRRKKSAPLKAQNIDFSGGSSLLPCEQLDTSGHHALPRYLHYSRVACWQLPHRKKQGNADSYRPC